MKYFLHLGEYIIVVIFHLKLKLNHFISHLQYLIKKQPRQLVVMRKSNFMLLSYINVVIIILWYPQINFDLSLITNTINIICRQVFFNHRMQNCYRQSRYTTVPNYKYTHSVYLKKIYLIEIYWEHFMWWSWTNIKNFLSTNSVGLHSFNYAASSDNYFSYKLSLVEALT